MADGQHPLRWFDISSLILAIIALLVAFVHLFELGHAVSRIERVQEGLSTRYLGEYPVFFPKLVNVIRGAQRNIVIACDFPAYGELSQRSTADDYYYAIKKGRAHANVDVMFLNPANREKLLEVLFSPNTWSNWEADPSKQASVAELLKFHARPPESVHNRTALLRLLNDVNNETIRDVFLNRASEAVTDMPVYFWVADCREAVFAIANPQDGTEHGFFTSDKSLIKGLLDIRSRYNADPRVLATLSKPCG
jgi:hypothetical protein